MAEPVTPPMEERMARMEKLFKVGKEKNYAHPWGALFAAYVQQRWVLVALLIAFLASITGNVMMAILWKKRDTWVFMKDNLGNVVQTDPRTFAGGDQRDEMEVKGFAVRWVRDAYEFTPLDVRNRIMYALRFVEPKAQPNARDAMRMVERTQLSKEANSVHLDDEPDKGQVPQVTVLRWKPMEVLVVCGRHSIGPDGVKKPIQAVAVRLFMRQVPRSPSNPNGLIVTDVSATSQS